VSLFYHHPWLVAGGSSRLNYTYGSDTSRDSISQDTQRASSGNGDATPEQQGYVIRLSAGVRGVSFDLSGSHSLASRYHCWRTRLTRGLLRIRRPLPLGTIVVAWDSSPVPGCDRAALTKGLIGMSPTPLSGQGGRGGRRGGGFARPRL
jgi:hypothetical protein